MNLSSTLILPHRQTIDYLKKKSILLLVLFFQTSSHAQSEPIPQIIKHYFRSNPYHIKFSSFLNHLINDPTLSNKKIIRRTDTSFFFFQGNYTTHNPFGFKADRTEIRLAETEVAMDDSLPTMDTLLLYQLLGYSYSKEGTATVKNEFSKFNRKYNKNLYSQDAEIKRGNEVVGGIKNYFALVSPFSPISIAWARLDDLQSVFTITIRIKVIENMATLPIPSDGRQ
jgi:hypothetical protein